MRSLLICGLLYSASQLLHQAVAHDHMGIHSLFPPILEHYWDNGLNYWSFGSETVVTDDMVRLTQSTPKSRGYLWNRHGNHLGSWEFNVTLQLDKIGANVKAAIEEERLAGGAVDVAAAAAAAGSPSASGYVPKKAGAALWFTTDTPRHGERSFFGAPPRFNGIGVTIDHQSVISVFLNDGYGVITDVERQRKGFCRATTRTVTITVRYNEAAKTLSVSYVPEDKFYDKSSLVDKTERDFQATDRASRRRLMDTMGGNCASLTNVSSVVTHSYFGITAANTAASFARVEVQKVFVSPLSGSAEDEEELVGLKLFDRVLDIAEKRLTTGKDDVASNQFNFPPNEGGLLYRKKAKKLNAQPDVGNIPVAAKDLLNVVAGNFDNNPSTQSPKAAKGHPERAVVSGVTELEGVESLQRGGITKDVVVPMNRHNSDDSHVDQARQAHQHQMKHQYKHTIPKEVAEAKHEVQSNTNEKFDAGMPVANKATHFAT